MTDDEEVCSRLTSTTISYISSKAQLKTARANRLKAEHQLQKTEENLKLERERRELEMKEQLLEKQSELEEAKLEELVWQEIFNEDNETINANQNEGTSTEVAMCSNRNNNLKNSDINIQGIPATVVRKDSEAKCEFTAGSSQSNISSIDSAFHRLLYKRGLIYQKPELLTFDGKPIDYCKFIKNFETNIESRVSDDQMRFSYLIQYCKGEAKSSIEDCVLLEPTDGYNHAILLSRYGRSHIIARS